MVRAKGVEPSRPKAPEPKSGASTNSATRASNRGAWPTAATYCFATPRLVNAESSAWPSAWQNLCPICERSWTECSSVLECGSPCRFQCFLIGTKAVRSTALQDSWTIESWREMKHLLLGILIIQRVRFPSPAPLLHPSVWTVYNFDRSVEILILTKDSILNLPFILQLSMLRRGF